VIWSARYGTREFPVKFPAARQRITKSRQSCCIRDLYGENEKFPANSLLRAEESRQIGKAVAFVTFTAKTRNSLLIPCSDAKSADFGQNLRVLDRNHFIFPAFFPARRKFAALNLLPH
jgi:hypothetical protein